MLVPIVSADSQHIFGTVLVFFIVIKIMIEVSPVVEYVTDTNFHFTLFLNIFCANCRSKKRTGSFPIYPETDLSPTN
jgi:hypothetical protein